MILRSKTWLSRYTKKMSTKFISVSGRDITDRNNTKGNFIAQLHLSDDVLQHLFFAYAASHLTLIFCLSSLFVFYFVNCKYE